MSVIDDAQVINQAIIRLLLLGEVLCSDLLVAIYLGTFEGRRYLWV